MDRTEHHDIAMTVVGLFDDEIDAEHALSAIMKSRVPARSVSALVRDRDVVPESHEEFDLSNAITHTALVAAGSWLEGLAALVVPGQGRFLAAGPIGSLLGELGLHRDGREDPLDDLPDVGAWTLHLQRVFERFGFRPEEAHYLERRLEAGSAVIATTSNDESTVESTRRLFADHSAVFIGQAITTGAIFNDAQARLDYPAALLRERGIVADVVAPLRKLCGDRDRPALCGARVVDARGEPIGEVDELIAAVDPYTTIRYIVLGHGGVLGLARRRVAVPVEITAIGASGVSIQAERGWVLGAPAYDAAHPFSLSQEAETRGYFARQLPADANAVTDPIAEAM